MNAHASMILFIVTLLAAASLVGIYHSLVDEHQEAPDVPDLEEARIIGISAWGIEDREARYVTVRVAGGGERRNMTEALLTLTTERASLSQRVS